MKYCPFCGAALTGGAVSFCPECGNPIPTGALRRPRKKFWEKRAAPVQGPESEPPDDGYDGYYDDIVPLDNGHNRDRMAPELIKRIIILAAGAIFVVVLSVILMYVL
ncbi:MAG: zinc ribbon domain-containing protein [Firmicutes bacterium]|nr:zinc ribbon domain-containing protein [Bacillota bacterium]